MRVCIEIATGKLIESQTNDNASLETLILNAVASGHSEADIEAKVVTDSEFATLMEATKPLPTFEEKCEKEYPSDKKTIKEVLATLEAAGLILDGTGLRTLQDKRKAIEAKYSEGG